MDIDRMKNVDVRQVNPDELIDIKDVHVKTGQNQSKQLEDFISQIKNPYCYKYENYIVKIGFEDTSITLTERLKELVLKTANAM